MRRCRFFVSVSLLAIVASFSWGVEQAGAQGMGFNPVVNYALPNFAYSPNIRKFVNKLPGLGAAGCTPTPLLPASSGGCDANELGQYIPVAIADTLTYPGSATSPASDYYEISLNRYSLKLHSDLPPTTLRGYAQINTADHAIGNVNQYLGPLILARSYDPTKPAGDGCALPQTRSCNGKPVRIKFTNMLPTSSFSTSHLPLPVDTTVMGAGMGPIAGQMYTDNRSTIHLHGGNTPWISDGTPHQWITPAGDLSPYRKGASFQNVPDMVNGSVVNGTAVPCIGGSKCFTPNPGDGIGTFYWTNQQSARLMFYHDHAYGITRLNVYDGVAAGYLLVDQVEDDMIDGTNFSGAFSTPMAVLPNLGGVYQYGIPLVIQDKTFVNDASTDALRSPTFSGTPTEHTCGDCDGNPFGPNPGTDPLWAKYTVGTSGGDLWFPHEYMPNEDIYNTSGFNPMGRWDYGPFVNPAAIPVNLTLPSPSIIPEAFGDTMLVNGTAFPYITLPPTAVRFRILNACNDRFLNLQFYVADLANPTEVKMVPATSTPALPFCAPGAVLSPITGLPAGCTPTTWPKDGRDGGVPDPTLAGPQIIQIGNEGGILPKVALIPAQPVDFDYNRRSVTYGGIISQSLLMLPAERADIIVDLSGYAGQTLILYNDAPAPAPLFDTRNDNFTDDPDQTAVGGAPTTPAGFGPNTRTIMQIRVSAGSNPPFDLNSLKAALPQAYKASQAPPIVPQAAYNDAFGAGVYPNDIYANNVTESLNLTGTTQPVAKCMVALPGSGYTTPPTVTFTGGGGTGAAAVAKLNGVTGITVTAAGTGYTTPPTVTITRGGGTGAKAVASISGGGVTAITVVDGGSGYSTNPTVSISGGGGTGAKAVAGVTLGAVGTITLTSGGSGYISAPQVILTGGGGTGATADCMLNGALPIGMKNITEGFDITYGRMNAMLGTTPVPLDPLAPAPAVPGIAQYIDPPSDFWNDGQTYLFRVAHLGADSHAVHFHLANLQVVNRVDYTNTILPPHDNELGWKETIRTNPFTDLILAVRPKAMVLPFQIPQSVRLMDPTTPAGSTLNYVQPAPVPGLPNPAGISNVMTNYGWEYVWHCHLLGHEENDMMRPLVLVVAPPAAPSNLVAAPSALSVNPPTVALTWADNSSNETGLLLQRATNSNFTTGLTPFLFGPGVTTYTDTGPLNVNTTYYYRVQALGTFGNSVYSNVASAKTPGQLPASPTMQPAGTVTRSSVVLNWIDNANNETGFSIQRATNSSFTTGVSSVTVNTPNLTSYTSTRLSANTTYYFRVAARNAYGNGAWSNVVSTTTLP